MYRRKKNIAAPKITIIRMIQTIRGILSSSLNRYPREKILHPKTRFHILTHARDRWWSLWVRGAVLLRRRVRAPLRVEVGLGECRGYGDGQGSIPRLLHLRTARPVWPVSCDVVGAHEESGPARGRTRATAEGCHARAHGILLPLLAFDLALGLILHVRPPHHKKQAKLGGQYEDEGAW